MKRIAATAFACLLPFAHSFAAVDDAVKAVDKEWRAFEFVLSAKRPEGYTGDWRELPKNSDYLLVRQLAYDWVNEVDARLAVERLDRRAAKPRQTAEEIEAALKFIPEWTERWVKMGIGPKEGTKPWGEVRGTKDKIKLIDFTHDQGGRATQLYIAGQFDLKPDEALLYEMAPGKCRYWHLHLGREMLNRLDSMGYKAGYI